MCYADYSSENINVGEIYNYIYHVDIDVVKYD